MGDAGDLMPVVPLFNDAHPFTAEKLEGWFFIRLTTFGTTFQVMELGWDSKDLNDISSSLSPTIYEDGIEYNAIPTFDAWAEEERGGLARCEPPIVYSIPGRKYTDAEWQFGTPPPSPLDTNKAITVKIKHKVSGAVIRIYDPMVFCGIPPFSTNVHFKSPLVP